MEVSASFPAGSIGDTLSNLTAAAAGEHEEHASLYPEFAKTARGEGYEDVALVFEAISKAEAWHEKRFADLAANIKAGVVFRRKAPVAWRCLNCGYIHEGADAPESCPACLHPQAYFELRGQNW